MAFRTVGNAFTRFDDFTDMRKSIHMNLVTLEREARRGKKVKEQINILRAAKRLFDF